MERWQIMQIIDCHLRERGQDPEMWSVTIAGPFHGTFIVLEMGLWQPSNERFSGNFAHVDRDVTPTGLREIVDEAVCRFVPALNTEAMAS